MQLSHVTVVDGSMYIELASKTVARPQRAKGVTPTAAITAAVLRRRPASMTRSEKPLATGSKKHSGNPPFLAVLMDWQLFAGALLDSPGAEPARLVLRQPWC